MIYLVDTSVWIDFLRGTSNSKVSFLKSLIEDGKVAICEIIFAEICFGAQNEEQFKKYSKYFSTLPLLKLPEDWQDRIAHMGYQLRKHGHKPFIANLMIALAAITRRATLLTNDKDFDVFEKLFDLPLE